VFFRKPSVPPELAPVVFEISTKTTEMRRNGELKLPPALLGVLSMIDGVCPVAQYEPFMKRFAPIADKFLELEEAGYIQRVGRVSENAVSRFQESAASAHSVRDLHSIDSRQQESGFMPMSKSKH
jgi:hypothetical protein